MFDDQSLDIPCPRCSRKTAKTIRWLKTHDHFTCRCGSRIELDKDDLLRELKDVEKAIRDFRV